MKIICRLKFLQVVLVRASLVAGGFALGVVLLEISLHLFPGLLPMAVQQALTIYADGRQTSNIYKPFVASDQLIFIPQPGVDLYIHDGLNLQYTVQTRPFGDPPIGFRDIGDIQPTYAVAIGDSFTWGTYVEASQTWPEELQTLLNQSVVNMGVLGYGPPQYQILTTQYALPLHPQVVLWGFFSGNDVVNSAEYTQWFETGRQPASFIDPETGWRRFLSRHIRLYELVKFARRQGIYIQRQGTVSVAAPGGPAWTFYPDDLQRLADGQRPDVARGWEVTERDLLATEKALKTAETSFVIVIIPAKELVYWDLLKLHLADPSTYDLAAPERTLMAFCQTQGLHCLDLTPEFTAKAAAGEELYLRQDAHFNPAGHRLAAQEIAEYLRVAGLMPTK